MSNTAPREITPEEGVDLFLSLLASYARGWSRDPELSREEICDSMIFSMLVILDGKTTGLPAFNLVPDPHPDDEAYCKSVGRNWWGDKPINENVELHDMWRKYIQDKTAAWLPIATAPTDGTKFWAGGWFGGQAVSGMDQGYRQIGWTSEPKWIEHLTYDDPYLNKHGRTDGHRGWNHRNGPFPYSHGVTHWRPYIEVPPPPHNLPVIRIP